MADVDQFDVTVGTPGTRVRVSAVSLFVLGFEVVAWDTNVGDVSWGKSSVSQTRGLQLRAGDSKTFPSRKGGYNLLYHWIDGDNGGDGVTIIPI